MAIDQETIQALLDLLNPLHGSLDKQTYDEKVREDFNAPDDREYDVSVTARQERDLCQAVVMLERRQRETLTDPAAHNFIEALNAANLEYSGLSWSGKNVFGDRKSIDEVRRLTQLDNYVTALREENQRLRAKLDARDARDPADFV